MTGCRGSPVNAIMPKKCFKMFFSKNMYGSVKFCKNYELIVMKFVDITLDLKNTIKPGTI